MPKSPVLALRLPQEMLDRIDEYRRQMQKKANAKTLELSMTDAAKELLAMGLDVANLPPKKSAK